MSEKGGGAAPALVILAAGRARRYGGCKPLAPVGTHGEAVIDLVASDAVAAGFGTIVLVLGPSTGPAIRYHVEHTWPGAVDVRFATQPAPLGTVNAVLSASDHVGDAPLRRGQRRRHLRQRGLRPAGRPTCRHRSATSTRWWATACPTPSSAPRPSPGASAASADDGTLLGVDERRQVTRTPEGGFVAGDGREPASLSPDARVSMNLWGFTPAFHKTLQAAMDAAVDASEEAEVLLPEVVADSLATSSFTVLPAGGPLHRRHPSRRPLPGPGRAEPPGGGGRAPGQALGLPATERDRREQTPRDLPRHSRRVGPVTGVTQYMGRGTENENKGPDATQPRVTVRPKPPVLLGATSTTGRWHRAGIVSDNPRPSRSRRLQGSHRDAPRTISGRILLPTPVTLPLRGSLPFLDPALQRSLGFPPFRLAASLRASLAPTLRCSLEVRRAVVSELGTGCATRHTRSMAISRNPDVLPTFLRVIPK